MGKGHFFENKRKQLKYSIADNVQGKKDRSMISIWDSGIEYENYRYDTGTLY